MNMNNKRLVYTVILDDYDSLTEIKEKNENIDYICITDNKNITSNTWEVIYIEKEDNDSIIINRMYKMLPHRFFPHYQTLYIDGNIAIIKDINNLFDKYLTQNSFAAPKHSIRDCIYEESLACLKAKKEKEYNIHLLLMELHDKKYPFNNGLLENNILFRKNEKKINDIMEDWFVIFKNICQRDQLSLCYLLWENNIKYQFVKEGPRYERNYFKINFHNKEKKLNILKKIHLYSKLNNKNSKTAFIINKIIEALLQNRKLKK
ncbi:DUF616 domain-containing protein [Proteus faecis]|uniref:DUF616 domain-containing protein n=1 Tax=Proteus faecis TaxID=2050967 RepID=UPI0021BAA341|nr:DUF616 domain-containing protein [Proteus faecis]MCT8249412.1 DUF616 domain-containing protein [Proteus faecis]